MIISLLLVGMMAGFLIRHFAPPTFNLAKKWHASHKRFMCDVCKQKRARANSTPLALDLDYGDALLPLNIRICKVCAPDA